MHTLSLYLGSGAAAGAISRTATAPLERLKIFNQINGISKDAARYRGITASLRLMYQEEGIRGYFKGNGTNCVKVVPASAIRFLTFENVKKYLLKPGEHTLSPASKMIAGSTAGVAAVVCTYPLDLVRTRLSVQTSVKHYDGIFDAFRKIVAQNGVKGLFRGVGTAMTSVMPFSALNFTAYETLKEVVGPRMQTQSVFLSAGYGAASGAFAMTILYPLDLIKRRLMVEGHGGADVKGYRNGLHAFTVVLREEGIRGLYKGIVPSYLKVVPTVSLTWLSYEIMKKWLGLDVKRTKRAPPASAPVVVASASEKK